MDYCISIKDFEGPLDLLLHLVKEMKMDIYEIQTGVIIEEYLKYIQNLQDLNIDIASEFLVMASSLVHLKSKMLIGKTLEEENDDGEFAIQSEEDLKQKLLDYQKYKEVTKFYKELEEKRREVYTKVPERLKDYAEDVKLVNPGVTVDDLVQAFLNLQERIHYKEPIHTRVTKREISVESRRKRIWDVLDRKGKVFFEELFEIYTKEYVVVTFLALLDMTKNQEICLVQENNFEPIWVLKAGVQG